MNQFNQFLICVSLMFMAVMIFEMAKHIKHMKMMERFEFCQKYDDSSSEISWKADKLASCNSFMKRIDEVD